MFWDWTAFYYIMLKRKKWSKVHLAVPVSHNPKKMTMTKQNHNPSTWSTSLRFPTETRHFSKCTLIECSKKEILSFFSFFLGFLYWWIYKFSLARFPMNMEVMGFYQVLKSSWIGWSCWGWDSNIARRLHNEAKLWSCILRF